MNASFLKTNKIGLIGVILGLLFFALLGIRMGVLHLPNGPLPLPVSSLNDAPLSDSESWMNVFIKDQKIGYTHRKLKHMATGYALSEKTYLKMNIMGMVQELWLEASSSLNHDFSLSSFDFRLSSGTFDFIAKGSIQNNLLYITIGEEEKSLSVKPPVYLYTGLLDALKKMDFFFDKPVEYNTFDPISLANETVTIRLDKKEYIRMGNRSYDAAKLSIHYKGIVQNAWIDDAGNLLQETSPMGMRSVKTTKQEALDGFNVAKMKDLTESVSILPNVPITAPDKLTRITLELFGITKDVHLNGGRQQFKAPFLTITKEAFDPLHLNLSSNETDLEAFLKPSPLIQSDHEKIKKQVAAIVLPSDANSTKAVKLLNWIYNTLEKQPVLSIPNALETLENKKGDCNEHAVLLAAMARAANIPARIETGLVYTRGRFYYHAWNILYLGEWITADASFGQIPADVTHVRFTRGDMMDQTDLVQVIGNLKIHIPESSNDSVE